MNLRFLLLLPLKQRIKVNFEIKDKDDTCAGKSKIMEQFQVLIQPNNKPDH